MVIDGHAMDDAHAAVAFEQDRRAPFRMRAQWRICRGLKLSRIGARDFASPTQGRDFEPQIGAFHFDELRVRELNGRGAAAR
jgi:hypothetical protein